MISQLTVHGRGIEVAWWGEDRLDREPIVLLHEGLGSVAMWRDTPAAVAAITGRRVMAYSRAGHGGSDRPPTPHTIEFMHEEARDELPAILDEAGIPAAILYGHSDGGSIALMFAALYPARVRGLVLEATHVFVEDVSIASIERMKLRWANTPLRERLARYHVHVDAAFHGWNDVWLHPKFRDWNVESFLPQITCPVLVIQGRDDHYGTLRQVEAIERQVGGPVDSLILDECGHSPHRDRKTAVMHALAAFVIRASS